MLPLPQDCDQQGFCPEAPAPDLWEMTIVRRQGQPPLRFRGQRLAMLGRKVSCNVVLEIELWARRKGDFVLAYSDVSKGVPIAQASVFVSQNEAAAHLETVCNRGSSIADQSDPAIAVSHVFQALGLKQKFAILVGDFLSALDELDSRLPNKPVRKEA